MVNKGFRQVSIIAAAVALLVCLTPGWTCATEIHHFANGITATIYPPDEIADQWTTLEKGGTYLIHPASGSVELIDNSDVMYPFAVNDVVEALEAIHGFVTDVDVDVFILPATPAKVGGSFASRNAIFLAPGTGPVDPSTVAYITVHELGHVMTWAFMDDQPVRWKAYMDIRGLDASSLAASASHADRAREILAEDIRALFGGYLATAAGSIENHQLVHPSQVEGLKELLTEFFLGKDILPVEITSMAFPNPCNPRTTVEMIVPEGVALGGQAGVLRIFDIRGSLVRTLNGGHLANNRLAIQWDGTNSSGEVVSSGRYLYVLEMGKLVSKGAVTLVR
jgi:hypothetical protein